MSGGERSRGGAAPATADSGGLNATQLRRAIRRDHEHLVKLISGMSEEQATGASVLPGWTRAHVLTHVADVARAFTRLTRHALAGQLVEVYDGGRPARDASIKAGATRPARQLVADVTGACQELDGLWARLADEDWALPCRYRDADLHAVLLCRWREVAIHTSDLALGPTARGWTPQLCSHILAHLAARVPHGVHLALQAHQPEETHNYGVGDPITVTGHRNDLTAWLAGRPPLDGCTPAPATSPPSTPGREPVPPGTSGRPTRAT